jgi:class 3 adenylate cyclase
MEHILMGESVQRTKRAEGAGEIGRVCLTEEAFSRVENNFYFNYGKENHLLVIDEMSDEELGTYEITISGGRRPSSAVMTDRSVEGLTTEITELLNTVEALACFIPDAVLNLLVESASRRHIVPQFASPTILFVNLAGIPQSADRTKPGEEEILVSTFSRAFSLINAAVESHGGVLKKVTYHLYGSDIMIMFGIPNAHTNDPSRAAGAALSIRDIIMAIPDLHVGGEGIDIYCQIGLAIGPVFAAEIGDPRGRREFNVLGDTVNTAARLMAMAKENQILLTEEVFDKINHDFDCEDLGMIKLKGKADETSLLALTKLREGVLLY